MTWKRSALAGMSAGAAIWLARVASVSGQGAAPPGPQMAENVFQDIQVLRGIPADEFMDTMGMFASSLLYDCTGCHVKEILIDREAFAVSTPRIQTARMMVLMVNALNRTYFGGEQRVTCFSCHRGANAPEVVPDLGLQYGVPPENPNRMAIFADSRVTADEVFGSYLEALGGADRVRALTSFVATGTYAGFNTGEQVVPVEIVARAPNLRSQIVQTFEGPAVTTFDGTNAWASEGWRQLPLMTLTGGNLFGARFDGLLGFPAELQGAFSQWEGTYTAIDDREVVLLQGSNPGELPINLYFDDADLLVRAVRWRSTPVGTIPIQTDFADYRAVGGVRFPFETVITWTNGRSTIALESVQPNVPVDPSRFARPAPFQPQ